MIEYHQEPRLQCKTLFATHYHELQIWNSYSRVINLGMDVLEGATVWHFYTGLCPAAPTGAMGFTLPNWQEYGTGIRRARDLKRWKMEASPEQASIVDERTLAPDYSEIIDELRSLDIRA